MRAYLQSLEKAVDDVRPRPPDLQAQLATWFNGLPEFTRQRPFSMREFEQALSRPGRLISPALLALGWARKRRWDSRGQNHRYWVPPTTRHSRGSPT